MNTIYLLRYLFTVFLPGYTVSLKALKTHNAKLHGAVLYIYMRPPLGGASLIYLMGEMLLI